MSQSLSLFISAMDSDQTMQSLQAQNAELREAVLALTKGQAELKALLTPKKKKVKRTAGYNLRRSFRTPIKQVKVETETENSESDRESMKKSDQATVGHSDGEKGDTSYQDPFSENSKYKLLEERLAAMEIQKAPGRNFEDLGLVPDVVIPHKFKAPEFAKYDGVSCPEMHLKSYVRKIQPHTADRKLWIHFFQESLTGTQLEWYYQLESSTIRTWFDLANAFYEHYSYNSGLAPTRLQLQSMSMKSNENFREYAQKWRDLAARVQPPLADQELVDLFMGTLTGPYYTYLLGCASSGFTELILIGERVENGIRSGKIQNASTSGAKKPNQSVGAVHVSAVEIQQPLSQQRKHTSKRQFTKINLTLSQALQQLLKAGMITLRDPPQKPNTASHQYNPNARCAYHSDSPGHDTENCWPLKNKIQDLIDAGDIVFDPPEGPNAIAAPTPKHGKAANITDGQTDDFQIALVVSVAFSISAIA